MIDESFVTLCKTTHPCIIHCELCVWSRSDYLVPPTNPRCNPEDRIIYLRIESICRSLTTVIRCWRCSDMHVPDSRGCGDRWDYVSSPIACQGVLSFR